MALVAMLAVLGAFGCDGTAVNPEDEAVDVLDNAEKADGVVRPLGTYRNDAAAVGDFALVTLKADKTFYRETVVACFRAPCDPIRETGTYSWSKSGATRYVRFLDGATHELIDRYAYTLDGDALTLRVPHTNDRQHFTLTTEAWCDVAADCGVQGLGQGDCVGEWTCATAHQCAWECQSATPCEAAGGACVAVYPGTCPDGVIGDAADFGCGPGRGVQCCLP
jgi:hypothetical protein